MLPNCRIVNLLDRDELKIRYRPFDNSRVLDFIAITEHGVICTGGSKWRSIAFRT